MGILFQFLKTLLEMMGSVPDIKRINFLFYTTVVSQIIKSRTIFGKVLPSLIKCGSNFVKSMYFNFGRGGGSTLSVNKWLLVKSN